MYIYVNIAIPEEEEDDEEEEEDDEEEEEEVEDLSLLGCSWEKSPASLSGLWKPISSSGRHT